MDLGRKDALNEEIVFRRCQRIPPCGFVPQLSVNATVWQEGGTVLRDVVFPETATTVIHKAAARERLGTGGRKFLRLKVSLP